MSALPPLGLSASVTRILSLSGFSAQLKTRDIQSAFAEWENVSGGFKIKWIDDTNLLIVFQDAGVAKRAYLSTLASPHPILTSPASGVTATIKPYDGPDAQVVIQNVNTRPNHRAHASRASVSAPSAPPSHMRVNNHPDRLKVNGTGGPGYLSQSSSANSNLSSLGREPSPTLPNIPNQPTLNSLISSSLSPDISPIEHEPSVSPSPPTSDSTPAEASVYAAPPKIGDPGRRMVAGALGIRHPGLSHRSVSSGGSGSGDSTLKDVQKALAATVSVSD